MKGKPKKGRTKRPSTKSKVVDLKPKNTGKVKGGIAGLGGLAGSFLKDKK